MEKLNFNNSWKVRKLNSDEPFKDVDVPYDAMIFEETSDEAASGKNCCWKVCNDYEFVKTFKLEDGYKTSKLILEFEGVYRNATVYLNGEEVCFRPYGYTNFFIDITDKVKFEGTNELRVIARNADQPNQRWYSGCGILRPVNLYTLPSLHVELNSIKITTLDYVNKSIRIDLKTSSKSKIRLEILDDDIVIRAIEDEVVNDDRTYSTTISLPSLDLWDVDNPNLYKLRVTFKNDVQVETFGIRKVELDKEKGLLINGKRTLLYGACIHEDSGMLGAIIHPDGEERKIKLLKKVGYNAVRSAHNPISKDFLRAADRLGMLILDEYVDCWYIHKTKYDYVNYLEKYWKDDLKDMVEKDYNHPSVIMYSSGNEVGETAQKKGIALTKEFTDYFHSLDETRPVTCGINIFFNFVSSMGFGFYNDKKAEKEEAKNKKKKKKTKAVGSEFFNNLTNALGAPTLKFGAKFPGCDSATKKAFANLDIAGYNYGILRYKHDHKKYPDRFILGSETFCEDALLFVELSKKYPRIIGDFVWAGLDYLGEVGVGSWVHAEHTPDFTNGAGWMTAGSGRVDILGHELSEADYTRVAFGKQKIGVGVVPPKYVDMKHSVSSWKFSRAIPSWSFTKEEIGKEALVEVYSTGEKVRIAINDEVIATQKRHKSGRNTFKVAYKPGKLTAIALDKDGIEIANTDLTTAKAETKLVLVPDKSEYNVGGLIYVDIMLQDEDGILKPLEEFNFEVSNTNCVSLEGCGNANPYQPNGYKTNKVQTYFGKAQIIFKAAKAGNPTITVKGDNNLSATLKLSIK